MANFNKAFDHTMDHEGGYANDPDDRGGETYRGIARNAHDDWPGWQTIDALKSQPDFPRSLKSDANLQKTVRDFYKQKFWDRFRGDEIPDQAIAVELFDTGVNMGTGQAVKFLQRGLNVLNRGGTSYADIAEDGGFGSITLGALNSYLAKDPATHLLKILNILQGNHYIEIMRRDPVQEKYARGWLKRVSIEKS